MSVEDNKNLVRRYYDELWNKWNLDAAEELISPDISFRGSLAVTVHGLRGFGTVLAVAERRHVYRVLTTDRRDFAAIRVGPRLTRALELLP